MVKISIQLSDTAAVFFYLPIKGLTGQSLKKNRILVSIDPNNESSLRLFKRLTFSRQELSAESEYATIKYNANGDTVWVRRYNGPGDSYNYAEAIAVDNSGNVFVTGTSDASVTAFDYCTIKYTADGDTAWIRQYNGPNNSNDWATALTVELQAII